MKRKWSKVSAGLAVACSLLLASCSKDNVEGTGGGSDVDGEGYFATMIDVGKHGIDVKATDPGTEAEKAVSHVRIVLYGTADNAIAEYSWDLGIRYNYGSSGVFDGPDVADGDATTFVSKAREVVEKKKYHMLVLINPSDALLDLTKEGQPKSLIASGVHSPSAATGLSELVGRASGITTNTTTGNKFFMTNFQGFVTVNESDIYPTAAEAEDDPVVVSVERAVAKVSVTNNLPSSHPDYDIANLKWILDVTNKHTYWMRKMTYLANGKKAGSTTMESATSDREYIYAEDPNFSGNLDYSSTELMEEFNYMTAASFSTSSTWGTTNWEYAMENTMEAEEQYQNVTTRVLIQANYVPMGTYVEGSVTAGQGYFKYRGYYIGYSKMVDYVTTPSSIPDHLNGLAAVLTEWGITVTGGTNLSLTASKDANGLTYYHNGISYYTIPIRHLAKSASSETMGYGNFGIVRNNQYQVNINSFSGPGTIEPPTPPGPEIPDEEDENWVSAEVEILPWYVRSHDANL